MTEQIDELLSGMTAERMRALIMDLADKQPSGFRCAVIVSNIASVIIGKRDLGKGPARADAYMCVRRAIEQAVARIPDMNYVHGSP